SIVLQANPPVNGTGQWTVIAGLGGAFSDSSLANSTFTPNGGGLHTLVWTISTVCGSNSDTVQLFFPVSQTFSTCGDTLTDTRDGKQYPTVQIGTQCWMARNLNIGTMVTSTYIAGVEHTEMSDNGLIEKYCYNNLQAYCDTFGGLYSWTEMMAYDSTEAGKGICPDGWHIPSDGEWTTLTDLLGGPDSAGIYLKESGTTFWIAPNSGTNSSGFSALGAGHRNGTGAFALLGMQANFLTSTLYHYAANPFTPAYSTPWYRRLSNHLDHIVVNYHYASLTDAGSARCMLDTFQCTPQPDQAYAGPDTFNIPGTSLQLQANVPTAGNGTWAIVNGAGGSFADSTNANTHFIGLAGNSYILSWTITTACGSSSDSVEISFAAGAQLCPDSLIDTRDGQVYPVVEIGGRCWMGRNLN
ncbi:MAG: hypothetical protein IH599_02555, partial [Bacteroidales bacterium]|nr:hypothetical protein [Bacteroidales bacterium]